MKLSEVKREAHNSQSTVESWNTRISESRAQCEKWKEKYNTLLTEMQTASSTKGIWKQKYEDLKAAYDQGNWKQKYEELQSSNKADEWRQKYDDLRLAYEQGNWKQKFEDLQETYKRDNWKQRYDEATRVSSNDNARWKEKYENLRNTYQNEQKYPSFPVLQQQQSDWRRKYEELQVAYEREVEALTKDRDRLQNASRSQPYEDRFEERVSANWQTAEPNSREADRQKQYEAFECEAKEKVASVESNKKTEIEELRERLDNQSNEMAQWKEKFTTLETTIGQGQKNKWALTQSEFDKEADLVKQEKSTEDAQDEVNTEGGISIPRASKTLIEMESWKEKAHD